MDIPTLTLANQGYVSYLILTLKSRFDSFRFERASKGVSSGLGSGLQQLLYFDFLVVNFDFLCIFRKLYKLKLLLMKHFVAE